MDELEVITTQPATRYTQGQELMVVSPKTGKPYRVRVMGVKLASGQYVEGGTDWYYVLREVGSRHRLLRGGFLASGSTLEALLYEGEDG